MSHSDRTSSITPEPLKYQNILFSADTNMNLPLSILSMINRRWSNQKSSKGRAPGRTRCRIKHLIRRAKVILRCLKLPVRKKSEPAKKSTKIRFSRLKPLGSATVSTSLLASKICIGSPSSKLTRWLHPQSILTKNLSEASASKDRVCPMADWAPLGNLIGRIRGWLSTRKTSSA